MDRALEHGITKRKESSTPTNSSPGLILPGLLGQQYLILLSGVSVPLGARRLRIVSRHGNQVPLLELEVFLDVYESVEEGRCQFATLQVTQGNAICVWCIVSACQ